MARDIAKRLTDSIKIDPAKLITKFKIDRHFADITFEDLSDSELLEEFKQKKLINEQMTEWDRNQIMQQIFQNQSKLENLMDNISKEQEKLNQMKDQFSINEELVKKQEEINQLMENIMDEEMKKLMEELQKLMQDFDKDEFFKIAEEMKFNSEEMEKQMDNTMELLKRTEVEERVENTINKLDELAIKQEKLSEESKNKDSNKEELLEKQTEQQKEFENLKEEYQKTLEKNSELKEPMKLEKFEEEMKDISDTFEQSKQELSDSKASKASKSQKQNSQQMQEMSQQMQSMMASESSEETSENMEDLRQIIENLISFSFDQEEILTEQKTLNARDPRFKEYIVMQKNAQDNFDVIRDSLNALASRIPELGPLVNKEQSEIYRNLHIIMSEMGDNRRYMVEASQQLVMTSANNLALLLSEVMEQMQQQMAMQMKSDKPCNNCKKPGQGKPGGEMRDIQQGMKQQMQDMINMMKQGGQNPGGQQSEQIAKMIMQQEMMQKMINDMMNSGLSPESAKILNDVNRMMDENLSDIVNGKVTSQTVNRQEQILTRLLQAENSDRERETEQKRKSNEAKDYKLSNPDKAFIEKEKEIRFNELLQMSNLKLNSFYKNKYKEYLKKLGQN
jgi:hypothetical protein